MLLSLIVGTTMACDPGPQGLDDTDEIVQNLRDAGFPDSEIDVRDDGEVIVGGDAVVSLVASREMAGVDPDRGIDDFRQYRTTNLVADSIDTICIDGSDMTGLNSTALDNALDNYNDLDLSFRMVRTQGSTRGCDAEIVFEMVPGSAGKAGFPAGGLPYDSVTIGSSIASSGLSVLTHVMTHELGHCVGFRHTDYFDRSISCGVGGAESIAPEGAVHIAGTPTGATFNGSVMNACYNSGSTGDWVPADLTAIDALYQRDTDDLVWQHSSGQVHYWAMKHGTSTGGFNVDLPVGPDWTLRGVGDVNDDGTEDIVWQNSAGQVHYWAMRDGKKLGGYDIDAPVGSAWHLRGVGDLNGDGTADIVWQHTSGQVHYWPIVNGQNAGGVDIGAPVGSGWNLRGVGDVTGDGTDDIVWQTNGGQVHYWPIVDGAKAGGANIGSAVGSAWSLRGVGDVSGDGTDDIVWRHSGGQVHYWPIKNGIQIGGVDIGSVVGSAWFLRGVGSVE